MSDPKSQKSFSRDEVEEILRRAADHAKAATGDGILHEELLEAAREAGLDPSAIDAAAAELTAQREDKRAFADAEAEIREERSRGFIQSLLTYLVVGGFLTAINLTVASGAWIIWVLAIWGLFVALRGSRLLLPPDRRKVEKRVEKGRRRRKAENERLQRKREAEAWAERLRSEMKASAERADHAARASRNFEEAVDSGVQALLGVLARKIREVAAAAEASERQRADTDFNRYVDRKKRAAGEDVPPPAKVRVELRPMRSSSAPTPDEEEEEERDERRSSRRRNNR